MIPTIAPLLADVMTTAEVLTHPVSIGAVISSGLFGLLTLYINRRFDTKLVKQEARIEVLETDLGKCQEEHESSKQDRERLTKDVNSLKEQNRQEREAKHDYAKRVGPALNRVFILEDLIRKHYPEAARFLPLYEDNGTAEHTPLAPDPAPADANGLTW